MVHPVATIADMRMYTQNPQPDCNGVMKWGTNYPGTPCDDGLAYTGNDALNGLCMCQGTCVNDADGDGICDEVDNCPLLPGVSGTPCDDSNPCTLDDQLYLVFGGKLPTVPATMRIATTMGYAMHKTIAQR